MNFTLAIVGRPNVGKSTLFNRLVGKKLALVDNQPGVTRDLREGDAKLGNLRFTVVDTAGLEEASETTLQYRMSALSLNSIESSDACLFVIDARAGVTAADEIYADMVRKRANRVILVANKVEGRAADNGLYESFSLGLGAPLAISAEHGIGMGELYSILSELLEFDFDSNIAENIEIEEELTNIEGNEQVELDPIDFVIQKDRPLQISIIGRPNSGKSTLINKILGSDRLLTGPESGITRDAISISTVWFGQSFRMFDTAGMRKKAKVQSKLEKLSVSDGIRAIKFSELIVLLLDVNSSFESQDLRIADLAEREGRCVVIAVNKWDLESQKNKKILQLRERVSTLLPQLSGVPLVTLSGLTGLGLPNLHKKILEAYKIWNIRISTAKLNNWLIAKLIAHPPPTVNGKRVKIRYMTQVKARPPSFVLFTSVPDGLPESYKRYLVNGLRDDFKMLGTPIRLMLRAGKNPYDDKTKKRRIIS